MQNQMPVPQRHSLTKSELIAAYLQQMALPSMWHRILSESDYELWDTVLDPYSIPAIKFAFDTWIGGGKKFPNPSDITPMCASFAEQQEINQHRKEAKKGGMINPELAFLLAPEIVARARRFHAMGKNLGPPLEEWEISGMVAQAKARQGTGGIQAARFPNGNPKYNRELTQARALLNAGRSA